MPRQALATDLYYLPGVPHDAALRALMRATQEYTTWCVKRLADELKGGLALSSTEPNAFPRARKSRSSP